MILTFLIWGLMALILTGLSYLSPIKKEEDFTIVLLNGLCVLIALLSIIYFFHAIDLKVITAISIIALLSLYYHRDNLSQQIKSDQKSFAHCHWTSKALLFIGLICSISATIGTISNVDTGNYHAQSILWINSYPIIPGLGNLLGNLAYNQSSFLAEAFFSFSFANSTSFSVLNGFFVSSFIWSCCTKLPSATSKWEKHHWLSLVGLGGVFLYYQNWISSPSPDVIIALITYSAVIYIYKHHNLDKNQLTIFLLIGLTSLTIKLSAFSIPLLFLVALTYSNQKLKTVDWLKYAALILTTVGAWMMRNYVFSGYLIFPLPITGWLSPDWQVPLWYTRAIQETIHTFSIHPFIPTSEIIKLNSFEKIKLWIAYQGSINLTLVVFSIFFASYGVITSKRKVLNISLFLGLITWLISAPDFRFGSPLIYINLTLGLMNLPFHNAKSITIIKNASMIMCVLFFIRNWQPQNLYFYWWQPKKYNQSVTTVQRGINFNCNIPKSGSQCWDSKLPCIPMGFLPHVELRGSDFKSGFRYIEKPEQLFLSKTMLR